MYKLLLEELGMMFWTLWSERFHRERIGDFFSVNVVQRNDQTCYISLLLRNNINKSYLISTEILSEELKRIVSESYEFENWQDLNKKRDFLRFWHLTESSKELKNNSILEQYRSMSPSKHTLVEEFSAVVSMSYELEYCKKYKQIEFLAS